MSQSIFINYEILGIETDKSGSYFIDESDENANIITNFILDNNILIKRGDVIDIIKEEDRYRNDGKLIWNGEKALFLETSIDEYGAVPKEFIVYEEEFSPDYWSSNITHNNYYWPSLNYREQVCLSLVFDSELTDEEMWHGKFYHHGKEIHVIVDDQFDDNYIYDPNLQPRVTYSNGSVTYKGIPHRERYTKKYFEDKIMDLNYPFDFLAENNIEIKDGYDSVSLILVKDEY
jgi:hypothetical protein